MNRKTALRLFTVFLLLFFTCPLIAGTYTVDDDGPADFVKIQNAIDVAGPGDTIMVEAGTYNENISLKSDVDVMGAGFEDTIIKGGLTSHVVYANNVYNAVFDGFTVVDSGQTSSYAGIRINGGDLVVSNNLITNNLSGIRITGASSAIIKNNIVTINGISGGTLDYGIISLNSTPLITNNIIARNRGAGIYIGWLDSAGTRIINNTIVDNDHDGIWCYKSAPTIKNNIIVGNQYGIAASHDPAAIPINSYNDVWNNVDNYNSQSGGVSAPGTGAISVDPLLIPPASTFARGYYLDETSPCIDAGDPNPLYNDIDDTRNDMGAYGGMDSLPSHVYSGVTSGFVFTTVGKIPVSEITQTVGDQNGLANVSPDAADDLYIYEYTDAPFGGKLWISGLFGSDPLDDQVRYYRILVAKWNPMKMFYQPIEDGLTKVLYTVNADGTVTASREIIGPLANWKNLRGLYRRTDTGYWAHRELKIVWNTGWFEDGLYSLTYEAYDSGLNRLTLPWNTQSSITLRIDNSPVEAQIYNVRYDDNTIIPECGIINLADTTENLKFDIAAWHANGFLRNYRLSVLYGKNKDAGYITADQYVGSNDGSPPFWQGVNDTFNSWDAMKAGHLKPWLDPGCAYQFRLRVWARTTDGYHHIRYGEFNDHYYINLGPQTKCKGDFDADGDVDGSDLSVFAREFGRTDCKP